MKAYIILVGTELLNSPMLETNSLYMTEELNKIGIDLVGKLIVPDNIKDIVEAINFAKTKSDLLILSGGLGPTIDDLTKDAISEFLCKKLVVDEFHKKEMERKFYERNIPILEKNIKEVMVLEDSIVFHNEKGIAPPFYKDGIVAFPGVPLELKNTFPKFIDYILKNSNIKKSIYIRDLLVFDIPESILEEKIINIFEKKSISLEFLVKNYGIIIRLISTDDNKKEIEECIEKTAHILGENLVSTKGNKIEEELLKKLNFLKYNIKLAESCTGGLITSTLVSLAGVSDVLQEGLVTYSNQSKIERLGVKQEILEKYGAVSEECVKEMLFGLDSDTAIAVSGIAGPEGGTADKPVGTIYIGTRVKEKIKIKKYKLQGDREKIRIKTNYTALFNLLNMLP